MFRSKRTLALVAGVGVAALSAGALAQAPSFFRIASGSAGGSYYPIAGLIANAISNPPGSRPCEEGGSCGVPGLIAVAQSANGSVANVNAIQSGAVESGFSQSDVTHWAYNGSGLFEGKEPLKDLRFIANLYPEHVHVYTRSDSDIETFEDLRGKRINIGLPASGAKVGATLILEAGGMVENEDYEAAYLNTQQATERLQDEQIDAALTVTGYPSAGIAQLASVVGLKLIDIPQEVQDKVVEQAPFYYSAEIPADAYQGLEDATSTVAVGAQWLVGADVDEELVYGVTKALWNENSRELLDNGHAKGASILQENALVGRVIPLHPGAERFYKEAGLVE
ncbi:TAXI family TRAP transporter solute-binding subunit [Acuticoccus sp.]|uniref:TAXI family TRAP transporter solute-binding subunit n=1 Tax=Acuticoccus sp. TaxID=1904378 RepID=UPI003B52116D